MITSLKIVQQQRKKGKHSTYTVLNLDEEQTSLKTLAQEHLNL